MTELPWVLMAAPPLAPAFPELGLGEPTCREQSQQALSQGEAESVAVYLKMPVFVLCGLFCTHSDSQ